jgi:hypothetical protein
MFFVCPLPIALNAPLADRVQERDARVARVLYEGEVSKRGNYVHNWRQRYFVLWRDGPTLHYWAKKGGVWKFKGAVPVSSIVSCTCRVFRHWTRFLQCWRPFPRPMPARRSPPHTHGVAVGGVAVRIVNSP